MQRADKRKFHYIYKITRDDGRYYIGMHSTDDLEDGYFGSGKKITRSIKKYGLERHVKTILEFLPTRESLRDREEQLVTEEVASDPLCMNIALGGGGGWEHANKVFKQSEYVKSGQLKENALKNLRNRSKQSLSDSSKKAWKTSREKMLSAAQVGLKIMNSAESNEKRKATYATRNHQSGEKNSQFGTCWVTKDSKPMKIKKEQLDEYLANGYSRGRTLVVFS
jgi:hypothetical protein